jgi:recA bacterial DNA recombination protein
MCNSQPRPAASAFPEIFEVLMASPLFSAPAGGAAVVVPRKEPAQVLRHLTALPKLTGVTAASRLEARPAPEMVSSGIREIDELAGGLPRGCLSEICGPASSGRTSVLLAALAAATRRQEACALVDTTDALDAVSAAAAGVELGRLLWIRCGRASDVRRRTSDAGPQASGAASDVWNPRSGVRRLTPEVRRPTSDTRPLEQALRVTDLLLQSGGFGLVAIDLGDVPDAAARRIPLASWFRFQRAVEPTATVLLVVAQAPCAPACASLLIRLRSGQQLSAISSQLSAEEELSPAHAQLLEGLRVEGELLRSRMQRKPAQSITTAFATRAVRIA